VCIAGYISGDCIFWATAYVQSKVTIISGGVECRVRFQGQDIALSGEIRIEGCQKLVSNAYVVFRRRWWFL
jgi:hypothetical protein